MELWIGRKGWTNPYHIQCDDIGIISALKMLYGDGVSQDAAFEITVDQHDEEYLIACNGRTILSDSPVQTILNLIFESAIYCPALFSLHSGAVEANGKAQLFLASTGAGKTTLTAYLAHRGYPYISDDCVLVDRDTLFVVPDAAPCICVPQASPAWSGTAAPSAAQR